MTGHMERKRKLQRLSKPELTGLFDDTVLSEEERAVLDQIYIHKKTIGFVADLTGYSESGIKKIHSRALARINYTR